MGSVLPKDQPIQKPTLPIQPPITSKSIVIENENKNILLKNPAILPHSNNLKLNNYSNYSFINQQNQIKQKQIQNIKNQQNQKAFIANNSLKSNYQSYKHQKSQIKSNLVSNQIKQQEQKVYISPQQIYQDLKKEFSNSYIQQRILQRGKLQVNQKQMSTSQLQGKRLSKLLKHLKNYTAQQSCQIQQKMIQYEKNCLQKIQTLKMSQLSLQKSQRVSKLKNKNKSSKLQIFQSLNSIYQQLQKLNYNLRDNLQNSYSLVQCQNLISSYFQKYVAPVLNMSLKIVDQFKDLETVYNGSDIFKQKQCNHKTFSHKYYLQFKCFNCKMNKKARTWTTNNGLAQLYYKFALRYFIPEKYQEFPFQLQIKLKLYTQACNSCSKYAEQYMFQDTIKHFSLKFCQKILRFLAQEKKMSSNRGFKQPDLIHHQHDMCQACKMDRCPSDGYDNQGKIALCYFYHPRNGYQYIPKFNRRQDKNV